MNRIELLLYARLVDIHIEQFGLIDMTIKNAKRLKRKPPKDFLKSLSEAGLILGIALQMSRIIKEKNSILKHIETRLPIIGEVYEI